MDLLQVSYKILPVLWVVCLIIAALVLVKLFFILSKIDYLISDIVYKYNMAKEIASMPLKILLSLFKK